MICPSRVFNHLRLLIFSEFDKTAQARQSSAPLRQGVPEAANSAIHYLGNALLENTRRGSLSLTGEECAGWPSNGTGYNFEITAADVGAVVELGYAAEDIRRQAVALVGIYPPILSSERHNLSIPAGCILTGSSII